MLSRKNEDILINVMCTRFDAESFIFCKKRVAFSLPKALHSECIWCKSRKVLARIVFRFSGIVIRRQCRVLRRCWVNRPKATLLLWFFGDFRCGALLFVVIYVIYKYRNR